MTEKNKHIITCCCWLMILGRETLRGLLVLSGDLEWRGWYMQSPFNLDLWPSYVTMWNLMFIPLAIWIIWGAWHELEWKK